MNVSPVFLESERGDYVAVLRFGGARDENKIFRFVNNPLRGALYV
jgi:hypothetical protein